MLKKIRKVVWVPLILAILLTGAFTAGGVLRGSGPALNAAEAAPPAGAIAGLPSFRELVERVKPTVVNIRVVQKVARSSFSEKMPSQGHPFQEGPFGDLFRRFRDRGPGARRPTPDFHRRGLGSGFIYSRDGLIVTNNHVVRGADEIRVTLHDGRTFEAKVLGRDPKTDLALLKITEKVDLPAVTFGDSDALAAGDWVLAIGNPFGLGHTVTAGIVSGKGRSIGAGPYDDFIQTDASINPGNSGGPLFNVRGEVVGVNTAILPNGRGIGFSIPINLTRDVVGSLNARGYVSRAWLGVQIQNVTPGLAKAFGLKKGRGALVAEVLPDGPAERAGMKRGDVIVSFAGRKVDSAQALPALVARAAIGKVVKVQAVRNGKNRTFTVSLDEMKDAARKVSPAKKTGYHIGVQVRPLSEGEIARLGLEKGTGLRIVSVVPGSPAARGGLRNGDVIVEVNGKPAGKVEILRSEAASADKDMGLLLLVKRNRGSLYLAIPKG